MPYQSYPDKDKESELRRCESAFKKSSNVDVDAYGNNEGDAYNASHRRGNNHMSGEKVNSHKPYNYKTMKGSHKGSSSSSSSSKSGHGRKGNDYKGRMSGGSY